ncbi:MAG: hypothetical protein V7754_05235 [Halioglobus sp.]
MSQLIRDILERTRQRAEAGDSVAQYQIGRTYEEDSAKEEALKWYRLSADNDYPPAMHKIAEDLASYAIFERDSESKERLLDKIRAYNAAAIAQNYLPAIHALGESYRTGDWYVENIDIALAIECHQLAAKGDYPESHYSLGVMLLDKEGSQEDVDCAIASLNRAAKLGLKAAQKKLARVFAGHYPGIPQNISMAHEWLRIAENNQET